MSASLELILKPTFLKLYRVITPSLFVNANGCTGTLRSAEPSLSVKLNLDCMKKVN